MSRRPPLRYREGFKYQLMQSVMLRVPITPAKTIETFFVALSTKGLLVIRKGYAWDGPSGPALDTKSAMRGSLVHDALYQLIRLGHLPPSVREPADRVYRDLVVEDGMPRWRAWLHFNCLRLFGAPAADPRGVRSVLTAP